MIEAKRPDTNTVFAQRCPTAGPFRDSVRLVLVGINARTDIGAATDSAPKSQTQLKRNRFTLHSEFDSSDTQSKPSIRLRIHLSAVSPENSNRCLLR